MYERMLNKQEKPAFADMAAYCGGCSHLFTALNEWLSAVHNTSQDISFPYGNQYGWGVAHRKKKKLICHVFAEDGAFTIMLRMSDKQYDSIYEQLQAYTQEYIDHKYPCGDGGWIHYRVTCQAHLDDAKTMLSVKCQ